MAELNCRKPLRNLRILPTETAHCPTRTGADLIVRDIGTDQELAGWGVALLESTSEWWWMPSSIWANSVCSSQRKQSSCAMWRETGWWTLLPSSSWHWWGTTGKSILSFAAYTRDWKDLEKLERVYQDAVRTVRGLGQVAYREHLMELGLFSVLRRRLRAELDSSLQLTEWELQRSLNPNSSQ